MHLVFEWYQNWPSVTVSRTVLLTLHHDDEHLRTHGRTLLLIHWVIFHWGLSSSLLCGNRICNRKNAECQVKPNAQCMRHKHKPKRFICQVETNANTSTRTSFTDFKSARGKILILVLSYPRVKPFSRWNSAFVLSLMLSLVLGSLVTTRTARPESSTLITGLPRLSRDNGQEKLVFPMPSLQSYCSWLYFVLRSRSYPRQYARKSCKGGRIRTSGLKRWFFKNSVVCVSLTRKISEKLLWHPTINNHKFSKSKRVTTGRTVMRPGVSHMLYRPEETVIRTMTPSA